jgi:small-conductance mechanosensitive channel
LLYFLSQSTQSAYQFHAADWLPAAAELLRGSIVVGGILLIGFVIFLALRKYILRVQLSGVFLLTFISTAFYFGIAIGLAKPLFTLQNVDSTTLWLTRAFYAVLLYVAVRLVDRLAIVPLMTRGGKVPLQRFVHQIILIVVAIFTILGYGSKVFGWPIDKFLAGSAVVSIVLGMALQESLGNFFSGLVMHVSSPFAIGDWIRCGGVEGRVTDMTWRAVTVHAGDDNYVIIPNSTFAKEQIVNFYNPTITTARSVLVGLEYDTPPCDAIAVLKAAALETRGVLTAPEPIVFLHDFASSAIVYRVKFWIEDASNYSTVEHGVRLNMWYRLKQHGFNIPYEVRTVEYVDLHKKIEQQTNQAVERRFKAVDNLPLLVGLSPEQRRAIASSSRDILLAPGQVFFRQGDAGDSFYLIRRGNVDVLLEQGNGNQPHKVATLGTQDFFGEMSALTGQPRSATIRAATALEAIEISKDDLNAVFKADPSVMEKVSHAVAERIAKNEATRKGFSSAAASASVVAEHKASILSRMLRFFGRSAD